MGRKARIRAAARSGRGRGRGRGLLGRGHGSPWQITAVHTSDALLGPDVVSADIDDVIAAVQNAPRGDDWSAVRPLVIPVLPRQRPQPPGVPPPLQRVMAPGVVVGFGVDIGPAFMTMTKAQCEVLGISEADLVAASLGNLVARAEQVDRRAVFRDDESGRPISALQTGRSIGSALVLVPDQLRRLFGPAPAVFIAPMRDVILGLPADVEPAEAAWWFEEFASQDPNHLAPVAFRFDGRKVVPATLGAQDIP